MRTSFDPYTLDHALKPEIRFPVTMRVAHSRFLVFSHQPDRGEVRSFRPDLLTAIGTVAVPNPGRHSHSETDFRLKSPTTKLPSAAGGG